MTVHGRRCGLLHPAADELQIAVALHGPAQPMWAKSPGVVDMWPDDMRMLPRSAGIPNVAAVGSPVVEHGAQPNRSHACSYGLVGIDTCVIRYMWFRLADQPGWTNVQVKGRVRKVNSYSSQKVVDN